MPKLIQQEDGNVRWDYDLEPEQPAKKKAAKKAASTSEKES